MIREKLHSFIDRAIDNKKITVEDIARLKEEVLRGGLSSRQEADALIALDRIVATHESWSDAIVPLIVDYVVWKSNPSGVVPAEICHWLINSLEVGAMTDTVARIATAVVREAETVDVAMVNFVLNRIRGNAALQCGPAAA